MKKPLIIGLVCINVLLVAALVFTAGTPRANAQVYRGGADYLMVSGHVGTDWDAVYILDLGGRKLLGLRYDKTRKQMMPIRGRELNNDFRRGGTDKNAGGRGYRR